MGAWPVLYLIRIDRLDFNTSWKSSLKCLPHQSPSGHEITPNALRVRFIYLPDKLLVNAATLSNPEWTVPPSIGAVLTSIFVPVIKTQYRSKFLPHWHCKASSSCLHWLLSAYLQGTAGSWSNCLGFHVIVQKLNLSYWYRYIFSPEDLGLFYHSIRKFVCLLLFQTLPIKYVWLPQILNFYGSIGWYFSRSFSRSGMNTAAQSKKHTTSLWGPAFIGLLPVAYELTRATSSHQTDEN